MLLFWFAFSVLRPFAVQAEFFDCSKVLTQPVITATFSRTPTGDFSFRDTLPETAIADSAPATHFGAYSLPYPKVIFPKGVDRLAWSRVRLVEAAKKWLGLPYAHHHIPSMGGIDCSNFTAWVYNYALGIRFTSNVVAQSQEIGRRLSPDEKLAPGDLIYLYDRDGSGNISHAMLYVDDETIIDSHLDDGGVHLRPFAGIKTRIAWARRLLE
jgi:cell wall-associated NlpC family hydrolase